MTDEIMHHSTVVNVTVELPNRQFIGISMTCNCNYSVNGIALVDGGNINITGLDIDFSGGGNIDAAINGLITQLSTTISSLTVNQGDGISVVNSGTATDPVFDIAINSPDLFIQHAETDPSGGVMTLPDTASIVLFVTRNGVILDPATYSHSGATVTVTGDIDGDFQVLGAK